MDLTYNEKRKELQQIIRGRQHGQLQFFGDICQMKKSYTSMTFKNIWEYVSSEKPDGI